MLRNKPKTIFIFDINGTLDLGEITLEKKFELLNIKLIFEVLKNDNTWIGTWSGLNVWYQIQLNNDLEFKFDFCMQKDQTLNFLNSIYSFFKCTKNDINVIVCGDSDEDKWLAYYAHLDFYYVNDFYNKFLKKTVPSLYYNADRYQDILLPNKKISGFRDCEKTWGYFKDKIDFKDKIILDVGCNSGYFIIQSLIKECKYCYGIDLNEFHNPNELKFKPKNILNPFEVCNIVLDQWGFKDKVKLIQDDWETCEFNNIIDIVYLFNVIGYWKDIKQSFEKILKLNSNIILCELEFTKEIEDLIKKYNYIIHYTIDGCWNGRKFIYLMK